MPIDRDTALATRISPVEVDIERSRLRLFATVTGQTDPVYADLAAAKAAGHRDLPIPPTFLFSLELESPDPFGYLAGLGVDLRHVLHGEQSFRYDALVYAGDTVTLQPKIVDAYTRSNGALDFLVKQTEITREGDQVALTTSVIIVRNPQTPA